MEQGQISERQGTTFENLSTALRVLLAVNFTLIALSYTAWFSGTAEAPGFADQVFGKITLGGFRGDLVWLILTTLVIFLILLLLFNAQKSQRKEIDCWLCVAQIAAFIAYIWHILTSGVLYFG